MLTNRTPRSTSRRASRQFVAKSRYWPGPPSRLTLIGGVGALHAVHVERLLRFLRQIVQFQRRRLHPKRQFIGGDAAGDFRVAHFGAAGPRSDRARHPSRSAAAAAACRADFAGAAPLAVSAKMHARIMRAQKAAAPHGRAAGWCRGRRSARHRPADPATRFPGHTPASFPSRAVPARRGRTASSAAAG